MECSSIFLILDDILWKTEFNVLEQFFHFFSTQQSDLTYRTYSFGDFPSTVEASTICAIENLGIICSWLSVSIVLYLWIKPISHCIQL